MNLIPRASRGASATRTTNGWRMEIPAGDASAYCFAQLDDYGGLPRRAFPVQPPFTLQLRARASGNSLPGTWGFGLWNDPFGISLGFGGNPWRMPALPNALWFFHASEENYLSFGKPTLSTQPDNAANGFLAQIFRSPVIPAPILALGGLTALPFLATRKSRGWLRGLVGHTIGEAGVRIHVDVTDWHTYRLEWNPDRSSFWVDEALILETLLSPEPPLGLIVWIDNQFAKFTPQGDIGFGILKNEAAWLEIEHPRLE